MFLKKPKNNNQLFDYSRTLTEKDVKQKSAHNWQNPRVKQIYNNWRYNLKEWRDQSNQKG